MGSPTAIDLFAGLGGWSEGAAVIEVRVTAWKDRLFAPIAHRQSSRLVSGRWQVRFLLGASLHEEKVMQWSSDMREISGFGGGYDPDPDATIQPNFGEHGSGVRVRRARTDPRPEILTALTAEQEAALGTRPDPELAAEWGIGAGVVFRARHRLGIPAFKYR